MYLLLSSLKQKKKAFRVGLHQTYIYGCKYNDVVKLLKTTCSANKFLTVYLSLYAYTCMHIKYQRRIAFASNYEERNKFQLSRNEGKKKKIS